MPFDENGFLGKEAEKWAAEMLQRNKKYFELCYEINSFAEKIKYKFIQNQTGQKMVVAALFTRLLEGYQTAIILVNRGLEEDARVIIRTVLETLFLLKACCEDKEFVDQYMKSDEKKRLKLMNVVNN